MATATSTSGGARAFVVDTNGQWTVIVALSQVWTPRPEGSEPYRHTWRAAVDVWADYRALVEDARALGFLR